jgi:predicted Fe-Mo cluster-binding NifX family protein
MKIAVTSQNRKNVTEHAGRCRKFWIYTVEDDEVVDKSLLELPKEQAFHESSPHAPHPLDDINVLIAGGMGQGLRQRLERKGVTALVTGEHDPDTAVSRYLADALESAAPRPHARGRDQESEAGT